MDEPAPGRYYHFKRPDQFYEVLGTALHTETEEPMVVYRALYDEGKLYVRPLAMFMEHVEKPEYQYSGSRFVRAEGNEHGEA